MAHPLRHDASAGLVRVALAHGETAAALAVLQPLLDHVAAGGTLGESQEREVELTCYQALTRAGDPRAFDWLVRAHTVLMERAATIVDTAVRQGFLQNVPYHREIIATWAQRGASGA